MTSDTTPAPWTLLTRLEVSGLGNTRRLLGYLLRAMVWAIDRDRIGKHRSDRLPAELGANLLPIALGASSTLQFFSDLCERFSVEPSAIPGPDGTRSLMVFFRATRERIEWTRLLACPAMALDLVREALRESPELYATFATGRPSEDPEDDDRLWEDLAAQPAQTHVAHAADMPAPDRMIPTPLWAAVLTLTSPLAHGADSKSGNINLVRREPVVDPLTGRRSEVPFLAGNALRGQMRDLMMLRYLALLGLAPEEIPPGVAHALLAGGSIEAGADTLGVVLSVRRALRTNCPPFDLVAGCPPGQPPMAGILSVHDALLVCRENAWRLHPFLARPGETPAALAARLSPADTLVTTRQSIRQSHRELPGADGSQMIMQTEVILAGAQMVHALRYKPEGVRSELSGSCLADALEFLARGGLTGARTSSAFGTFVTEGWLPRHGAEPLPDASIYHEWIRSRRDELRAWVLAGAYPQGVVSVETGTSDDAKVAAGKGKAGRGRGKAAPAPAPVAVEPDPVVTDESTGEQRPLF
jgi:hypothetical protein